VACGEREARSVYRRRQREPRSDHGFQDFTDGSGRRGGAQKRSQKETKRTKVWMVRCWAAEVPRDNLIAPMVWRLGTKSAGARSGMNGGFLMVDLFPTGAISSFTITRLCKQLTLLDTPTIWPLRTPRWCRRSCSPRVAWRRWPRSLVDGGLRNKTSSFVAFSIDEEAVVLLERESLTMNNLRTGAFRWSRRISEWRSQKYG